MDMNAINLMWKKKANMYKLAFSTEEGKYVLNDLYKFSKISHPSYVENSPDKTAFNEGAKAMAYYIKNTLKQSAADVDKFLEEYSKSTNNNILKGTNVRR